MHVADLGGAVAGGLASLAADTFAEGMALPPVRLYRAGQSNDDVWRILGGNSRTPAKVLGDIHALVAGTFVLAAGVEQLTERYGNCRADGLHHLPPRRHRAPDPPRARVVASGSLSRRVHDRQ